MQVSFFLADKSVGAKGFKAIWTEIKDDDLCPPDMFKCEFSTFCISKQLTCNGIHNCGQDKHGNIDQSDEKQAFCVKESEMNEYVVIGLGLGVISIVMIAVFLVCHRKRKRRRLEHPMLPSHAHFHTCESIGERFATSSSINSVWPYGQKADEEKFVSSKRKMYYWIYIRCKLVWRIEPGLINGPIHNKMLPNNFPVMLQKVIISIN